MSAEELRKDVIEEQLISMHVSPTFLGFGYLVSGISICIDDPSYEHNITSRLYPMIAQEHGVTAASVERCIRAAINSIRNNSGQPIKIDLHYAESLFTDYISAAMFISIIAHKIAHEYRYGNAKEEDRPIRISDMRDKKSNDQTVKRFSGNKTHNSTKQKTPK